MNHIISHLKNFVGLEDPWQYEYDDYENGEMDRPDYQNPYPEDYTPPSYPESKPHYHQPLRDTYASTRSAGTGSMSNVVRLPRDYRVSEVVVLEPHSFEETPSVLQALREQKTVLLNLTLMDPTHAQRAVDFVAGGTYAIDGHQQRICENIFLFTPNSVHINTQQESVPQPPPINPSQELASYFNGFTLR